MENRNEERLNEWVNETGEGIKDEWKRENIKDLMNEFVEDNQAEFNIFLENCFIDEERDLNYWIEIFCKEEQEEEFNNYVEDSFKDSCDIEETRKSLRSFR